MARNRFNDLREIRYSNAEHCIFISHKKEDSDKARQIADYLIESGIDVYYDEYDSSIDSDDPYSVVDAIRKGIEKSNKMLCFYTKNSLKSQWIPWEVGYGYGFGFDLKSIICLTEKELCDIELPDYLMIVKPIRGITSLNNYISRLIGKPVRKLILEERLFSANLQHPLDDVLQWDK